MTPRHFRLLSALLVWDESSATLRDLVGCNNISDEVCRAREQFGLAIDCEMTSGTDRDGQNIRYGIYSLADADRTKVPALLAQYEADEARSKARDKSGSKTGRKARKGPPEPPQGHAGTDATTAPAETQQPGSTGIAGATAPKTALARWRCAPGRAQEGAP